MNWRFPFVVSMLLFGTGALIAATPNYELKAPLTAVHARPLIEPKTELPAPITIEVPTIEADSPWLLFPVQGQLRRPLKNSFTDRRSGGRSHNAIDILAETGTPLVATVDGTIKLMKFRGIAGRYVYLMSDDQQYVFLYAHLSGYADGLEEGQSVKRGDLLGYVGDTGNAKGHPHLHLAMFHIDDIKSWWKGTPINPYDAISSAENAPKPEDAKYPQ